MSASKETPSIAADAHSKSHLVLDFLYHDSRRVGSFLSQFESGHLTQFTRTHEATESATETASRELSLGSTHLLAGKHASNDSNLAGTRDGSQRVYDPLWTNARAFLDYLNEHDLIQRDLADATLGQFVLATGFLSIQDLVMFKDAWKLNAIQKMIKQGAGIGAPMGNLSAAQKASVKEQQNNMEALLELIQIMPHAVHATLLKAGESPAMVWCSLRDEYMSIPASEIQLMHGDFIPGEWSILGVLSAGPDMGVDVSNETGNTEPGVMQSVVGVMSKMLLPIIRISLGRPRLAFGVTPLLIFREVS